MGIVACVCAWVRLCWFMSVCVCVWKDRSVCFNVCWAHLSITLTTHTHTRTHTDTHSHTYPHTISRMSSRWSTSLWGETCHIAPLSTVPANIPRGVLAFSCSVTVAVSVSSLATSAALLHTHTW